MAWGVDNSPPCGESPPRSSPPLLPGSAWRFRRTPLRNLLVASLSTLLVVTAGCGGARNPSTNSSNTVPDNGFKVTVASTTVTASPGSAQSFTVGIVRGRNFSANVNLTSSGAPQGVLVTFPAGAAAGDSAVGRVEVPFGL